MIVFGDSSRGVIKKYNDSSKIKNNNNIRLDGYLGGKVTS